MNTRMRSNLLAELKENRLGTLAAGTILLLIAASALAFLSPHDPNRIDVMAHLEPSSREHFFGTDPLGRDYFARALYGGRVSLTVGFLSMIISTAIGTLVGTVSGYAGGRVDSILMRLVVGYV